KNPIFAGPYKLSKQVTGESTSWVPNKYYYGKKAQIKHITIQVVNPSNFTSSLKAKQYDFAQSGGVNTQYPQVKQLKDYKDVGTMGTSYDLLGFNVGHFDSKKQENVMDSNMKMGNVKLRQAMMYALDIGALRKKFDNGLSWLPNSVISPYYKKYYNSKTPRYTLNISKAN
ncbi:ABC transporter substrate-binding protein, partial [Enterococcus lactis]|uniref:ABC transporter substrate-binding protein n=1 Tax=Enterococcus lactis TaxID=357441 RepID=UPI0039081C04